MKVNKEFVKLLVVCFLLVLLGNFVTSESDTIAPVITSHDDVIVNTSIGMNTAVVNYTLPTATDNVDESVSVICLPASGDTFVLGPTLVTCTSTDSSNNTANSTFNIIVQDKEAPTIDAIDNQTIEATSSEGNITRFTAPMSRDNVDGNVVSSCNHHSGDLFQLGTTIVTCSKTDSSENTGSTIFTITVQDTTAPNIYLVGGNVTLTVGDSYIDSGATANDTISGNLTSRINITNDVNTAVAGTYIVQFNVTDNSGNSAYINRTITINNASLTTYHGGGGYCSTQWNCSAWNVCSNGIQTRTCSYPTNFCTPISKKPSTTQTCLVNSSPISNQSTTQETNITTSSAPTLLGGLLGAVIGTVGKWSIGIILFIILAGVVYWIVSRRNKAP